jgi:hypothetical protein
MIFFRFLRGWWGAPAFQPVVSGPGRVCVRDAAAAVTASDEVLGSLTVDIVVPSGSCV